MTFSSYSFWLQFIIFVSSHSVLSNICSWYRIVKFILIAMDSILWWYYCWFQRLKVCLIVWAYVILWLILSSHWLVQVKMFAPAPGCPTFLADTAWDVSTNTSTLYCTVSSTWRSWHGFRQHLLRLWRPLPTGVGLVLLVVLQWRYIRRKEPSTDSKTVDIARNWEVSKFTFLIDSCFINLKQFAIKLWKYVA